MLLSENKFQIPQFILLDVKIMFLDRFFTLILLLMLRLNILIYLTFSLIMD